MALRTFHPCAFNFETTNIQRVGNVSSGGTSLSGIDDPIETDGGGFLQAEFSDGYTLDKTAGNAWRVLADADADAAFNVLLCAERLFQPVGALHTVPHTDDPAFSDGSAYTNPSADYATTAAASLRATSVSFAGTAALGLVGGELFSILHPSWGWRAYRVGEINGSTITFRPPLREAIASGTKLEFDAPRCQMRKSGKPNSQTTDGTLTDCAVTFVEDMRLPS